MPMFVWILIKCVYASNHSKGVAIAVGVLKQSRFVHFHLESRSKYLAARRAKSSSIKYPRNPMAQKQSSYLYQLRD